MYFKIQRAMLTMNGLIRPDSMTPGSTEIIQAHSSQGFFLPTLPDIPLCRDQTKAPKGTVELEIIYGSSKDNLPYLLTYRGEPQLSFHMDMEEKKGQITIVTAIKGLDHKRSGWLS